MKKWKFSEVGPIRFYRGEGDGLLIFHPNKVEVKWHRAAGIAAAHGAGNRSAKITVSKGKRTPPEIDIYFDTVRSLRALWRDESGPLSGDVDEARIANALEEPFLRHHACILLSAIAAGDFEMLQKFTDATQLARNQVDMAGIYFEVAEAIKVAAIAANEPPTKKDVFGAWKEGRSANLLGGKMDLRDELGRMGFGWLPAGGRGEGAKKRVGR